MFTVSQRCLIGFLTTFELTTQNLNDDSVDTWEEPSPLYMCKAYRCNFFLNSTSDFDTLPKLKNTGLGNNCRV